jgi:hypothetical protein
MTPWHRRTAAWVLGVAIAVVGTGAPRGEQSKIDNAPRPVRNDRPQSGRELLVLRHHGLREGGHEKFYRLSADNVWPFFERNGARIVGQWKIVEPRRASGRGDDVYRLVRYASFDHWLATRSTRSSSAAATGGGGADITLGGDGPAQARSIAGYATRGGLETGSRGAYFLQGVSATGGPYYMPGLNEEYDLVQKGQRPSTADAPIPVRVDVAQPGDEIVEIRYQRITKGRYGEFVEATRSAVWPWEEKLGARPMGQWLVVHPAAPSRTTATADYDEVITMTRYASRAHRNAMQDDVAVFMGGNGPDYDAWAAARRLQQKLAITTTVELADGFMYHSPPKFLPGLAERYQLRK